MLKGAVTAIALFSVAGHAQAQDLNSSGATQEDRAELTTSESDFEATQWNIWVCVAARRGWLSYGSQFKFGTSEPFPAGSGYGQTSRFQAYQSAVNQCGGWYSCVAECYVKRFQL